MLGLMQQQPLLISSLITHAQRHHGQTEIVSRRVEGDIHRTTWAKVGQRAAQVAHALDDWQVPQGARVGTLAWNGYRHLELYFGVSGSGRVLHTLNPRLHPDQLTWIVNHAEDTVLAFDTSFLPLVQKVHAQCPTVRHWVALCEADALPADTGIPNLVSYEAWLATHPLQYTWPELDERSASSMCYTSGTTGDPKGAVYSHRSTILHAYGGALPDTLGLSARDSVLPVVPMFHVNAWGIPYSAAAVGCKLVFPGGALDGASVYELIEAEGVTMAAGVPTVWQMLLAHMSQTQQRFGTLQRTVIGGSACPPAMIDTFVQTYGVEVLHAWGMTEMSPLGTVNTLKYSQLQSPLQTQRQARLKQGRAVYGVDMKIVDDQGAEVAWDGVQFGNLMVRGPWVIDNYFRASAPLLQDGWFHTGDVGTIDPDGFLQITDRSKDVVKSGGEWISSIDIENIAMAHPAVAMAACVGVPHPKWDERPVLFVVKKPHADIQGDALLAFYQDKIAKWQVPDDVIFVDAIPLGATGKMQKMALREQLGQYVHPDFR
ncbi:MAG: 3-(methylthio)propionyl-CoA ligase [Proteobacteria bacterium]|nr:3-(methylthio)propionyl-CoA ligase [Pseudomonadota bacterium]